MIKTATTLAILLSFMCGQALAENAGGEARQQRRAAKQQQQQQQQKSGGVANFFNDLFSSKPKRVLKPQPVIKAPVVIKKPKPAPKVVIPKPDPGPSPRVVAETNWWRTKGNRVVYNFRDCTAEYAVEQVSQGKFLPETDLVSQSIIGPCREQFREMATVLTDKFGAASYRKKTSKMVDSTFVPAIKNAVAKAHSGSQQPASPDPMDSPLKTSKHAMFTCFTTKADNLARRSKASDAIVAQAVLTTCKTNSDHYFDALFAKSKASVAEREALKKAAINDTYRHALERRIALERAGSKQAADSKNNNDKTVQ